MLDWSNFCSPVFHSFMKLYLPIAVVLLIDYPYRGEASHVDLLVSDIYGGDYNDVGLPGSTVAASLGKLLRPEVKKRKIRSGGVLLS